MDDIYLDANATTPVLPQARAVALAVMSEAYGNPSSIHTAGLRARAVLEQARACARRVLGAPDDAQLLFNSGATEGIQTAVLSALQHWRQRRDADAAVPPLLLYGATEHKAVPQALAHWNRLLGLGLRLQVIPVDEQGQHDLAWLRQHAAQAALVCTMAANNETGAISHLDGIAAALAGSAALWLVDGVQALGKLPLHLGQRRIDYAPFSGHKLYAPKGVGMLYVRAGAPFTPLMAGGGQEGALRSGTENMAGIAALGAVLAALESGTVFATPDQMHTWREQLILALNDAFPGVVFNTPLASSLPTTLNFSVPGLSAKLLLDLFDAAGLRLSGGSACSAGRAQPSEVLEAMGLAAWRCATAVRLSFGAADSADTIAQACQRLRACGEALRASGLGRPGQGGPAELDTVSRFVVDGACCYVLADAASRRCVVIDPLPELTHTLVQWIAGRELEPVAVLDTHSHGDHSSSAAALRAALAPAMATTGPVDALGWPVDAEQIALGEQRLSRLPLPGHTQDSTAYLLHEPRGLSLALVGDMVLPGALGRSDFAQSAPQTFAASLRTLAQQVGMHTLLLPGHDYEDRFATTLAIEATAQPLLAEALREQPDDERFVRTKAALERDLPPTQYQTMACGARVGGACAPERVELPAQDLIGWLVSGKEPLVIDVREPYEARMGLPTALPAQPQPLSTLINALPRLCETAARPMVFLCRSGNRSAQAARALRRLGHAQAWSLAGGLALWPQAV
jgi:cysteine sulfinate desulfinase/cysteine desulfurase-like protein/glyoxylase-like metal-dependent hydrolase (beta-lactamase superfamily II)/rhodanese-related sulfurtransferase